MQIKKIIYVTLIISLLIGMSYGAAAQEVKRAPRINFKGITGEDFIGQAGILYPFQNNKDALWFTDIRYRMSEDDVEEWNLGLGYRKKIDTAENHIAGIYAFKDRREEYDYYWDMWTLGGEILTDEWDFRLNGYITENEQVLAPYSTGSTSAYVNDSGKIVISPGKEVYYKSMNGLDIELGKRFTKTETIFKNVGVYAKLFRFFESDTPTLTGRQIRIDKQFGDRNKTTWKIGALWRDDNIRGSETEATFAVSIPFGEGKAADSETELNSEEIVEVRMTEQPERDLDIVVGESVSENTLVSEEEELTAYDSSGNELGRVWYVTAEDNDNTEGTEEKPIDIDYLIDNILNEIDINNVSTLIKPPQEPVLESNEVIVFIGGKNEFDLGNEYLDLKYGQKLLSTGYGELDVQSDNGTIETTFKAGGERANIIGNYELVKVNGNNIISGFEMKNDKDHVKIISGIGFSAYIDINNNIFRSYEEFSNESKNYVKINARAGSPYIIIDSSTASEEVRINIKNNILDRSNIKTILSKNANGISIYNNNNTNINISNNKIDRFYSGIYIDKLYADNQAAINDNEINGSIYGIYFYDIVGDNSEEKLENLALFNKLYENENKISDSAVDVFDHIIYDWYDLSLVNENRSSVYLMKSNLDSESRGYEQLASSSASSGKGWEAIGGEFSGFEGVFDGNNKTIGDLVINRPTEDYIGLFSYTSNGAVIKNLGLENVNIVGHQYVGGIAGKNSGIIENSYTAGEINAEGDIEMSGTPEMPMVMFNLGKYIGGIAGKNSGSINNSYSTAAINGDANVGGITGENSGDIINSFADSSVVGTNTVNAEPSRFINIGGLVGSNSGTISSSYSTSDVNGELSNDNVGGLVGNNDAENNDNIINSYWNIETSGQSSSDGGTGLSIEEMKVSTNYNGWDFETIWDIDETTNDGYPFLK